MKVCTARHARLPVVGYLSQNGVHDCPDKIFPVMSLPGGMFYRGDPAQEHFQWLDAHILFAETAHFVRFLYFVDPYIVQSGHVAGRMAPAVLQVRKATKRKSPPVVDVIYVIPELRRKGIATLLVNMAQEKFPNLSLDGNLSPDGAAFFGYQLPKQHRAA
ncbi:GNAT family N-acetyltransferase [Burkholderiaceae bacterium DAT-1]|nr:GNAT family N-acetyltransferase [Burkholderiaceae bacterium DAT-1]